MNTSQIDNLILNYGKSGSGRLVFGVFITFIIFNTSKLSLPMPKRFEQISESYWTKGAALALTMSWFTNKPLLSILGVAGMFIALHLNRHNVENFSPNVEDDDHARINLTDKVVLNQAVTDDIFRTQREFEVNESDENIVAATLSTYGVTIN